MSMYVPVLTKKNVDSVQIRHVVNEPGIKNDLSIIDHKIATSPLRFVFETRPIFVMRNAVTASIRDDSQGRADSAVCKLSANEVCWNRPGRKKK